MRLTLTRALNELLNELKLHRVEAFDKFQLKRVLNACNTSRDLMSWAF